MFSKLAVITFAFARLVGFDATWKLKATCSVIIPFNFTNCTIVARMAYDLMSEKNPNALEAVNKISHTLQEANPKLTNKESNYPFVECATLGDDFRMAGGQY
jgi:hypothetical protein